MNNATELRTQLKSLGIAKSQRPQAASVAARTVKRIVITLLIVGAGAIGAWRWREIAERIKTAPLLAATTQTEQVPLLTVTSRADDDAPPVLTATGKIVSDHRVAVSTKVSGQIVSLHFEQGDRVENGQVLARVEEVNYRARRDQAAANLERARVNLAYQKVNFARVEGLHDEANAKLIEYADARRWLEDAIAQVAADEAALTFAQKALDDCEVRAPIAGVILERNVEVGDFVAAEGGRGANANAQFGTIADMTKLRVEVDVSELDIARIRPDLPCVVTPDAYKDRKYQGRVMWIDPGANYSKATVQVKVRIEEPDNRLRVEGSAQVAFLSEASTAKENPTPTIWIPAASCMIDASGTAGFVFVLQGENFRRHEVQIGRRVGGQLEIVGGIATGERIAADGLSKLLDGQRHTGG
jgi:RND family efflux transporter MFP subunit